jgi:hypothetical protein
MSIALLWRRRPAWGWAFLVLVLALNGFETARAAISAEKITTQFDPITRFDNRYDQELIRFLMEEGELRGYSSYWVSFRLAFLSQEELIYAPRLPYKADLSYAPTDDRFPAYGEEVSSGPRLAYITVQHPKLDESLRKKLLNAQVDFSEKQIGPYHIFYDLSNPVHLEGVDWRE